MNLNIVKTQYKKFKEYVIFYLVLIAFDTYYIVFNFNKITQIGRILLILAIAISLLFLRVILFNRIPKFFKEYFEDRSNEH